MDDKSNVSKYFGNGNRIPQVDGEIFPKCGWVGWLIPKQGPNPPKLPRKLAFSTQISPFVFPNLTKKTWGGCMGSHIGETFPNKTVFSWGWALPYPLR